MAQQEHEIYGITYVTPHVPPKNQIYGSELPTKKQKFQRVVIPASFANVEYDKEGRGNYSADQLEFIDQQQYHMEHGCWFMNNGAPTYITGLHYFYLNFWVLDTDIYPDYRDADRKWFYFQDYCEKQRHIDGIIRLKKRREGATSQAACSLVYDSIMNTVAFCGIVSKDKETASGAFNDMVAHGYRNLPEFLKVRCEDENSKTKLIFRQKASKSAKQEKRKGQIFSDSLGLGSKIDFKPTKLNSYDGSRLTKLLVDEGAKYPPECPIDEYWPIVQKTMKQGAIRVGFCLMPSTTNRGENGGGGFRNIWEDSNQLKYTRTGTGLYRYFLPAYEGFAPYIDEYGMSIIDDPTPEQKAWLKRKYGLSDADASIGAKQAILEERARIKNPVALKKVILDYPLSEKEAFDFSEDSNIYNTACLTDQREYLIERGIKMRTVRFFETHEGKIDFIDDPNGMWKILYLPKDTEVNSVTYRGSMKSPGNRHKYVISVDPYKSTIKVGPGSMGAAFIWSKYNPLDPENTGMPIAMFWGRPRLRNMFHDQILYAARYYGAEVVYESDWDDYIEYYMERGYLGYAKEKPKNAIDPNRRRKVNIREYGVKSADSFALTSVINASVEYVELHSEKLYFIELVDDLINYEPDNRTDHDPAVAFQIGCLAIQEPVKKKEEEKKRVVVKTYDLTKQRW